MEFNNLIVLEQSAAITIPHYEELKSEFIRVADYINSVELSEDNVKEAKKTLADARKLTIRMNDERIRIKKEILKPYETLDAQVKELNGIINAADERLRVEVRLLEEHEREIKKDQLLDIWNKRIGLYTVEKLLSDPFSAWLTPQHLNKTYQISKAETDMVEWLEHTQRDLDVIDEMPDRDELLVEYDSCHDFAMACLRVSERHSAMEKVKVNNESTATFRVSGAANIKFVEMLLNTNSIEYERIN